MISNEPRYALDHARFDREPKSTIDRITFQTFS